MRKVEITRFDAFTRTVGKGNPAGVIFDGEAYTGEEMQLIAKTVGFNECYFICPSEVADVRLRYFTPGYETPLCGHATIGTIAALMERENIQHDTDLTVETLAGIIHVQYHAAAHEVTMEQADATFIAFEGDVPELLNAIGLTTSDYDDRYPIVYGSTGVWTLILPIKTLASFSKMQSRNELFPQVLKKFPRASVHPMTMECFDKRHTLHGRHFSSCYSGTVEDSVTGTASGVMGAYLLKFIQPGYPVDMMVEQGNEIGKEGTVHVFAKEAGSDIKVRIAGQAANAENFYIEID